MYNRYIPQPDGSYRRSRMPDQHRPVQPPCPPEPVCREPEPEPPKQEESAIGFLRRLLPKDFDTGDLLIVLLLLLMAGDCAEDQNTALLTLTLYFFM